MSELNGVTKEGLAENARIDRKALDAAIDNLVLTIQAVESHQATRSAALRYARLITKQQIKMCVDDHFGLADGQSEVNRG